MSSSVCQSTWPSVGIQGNQFAGRVLGVWIGNAGPPSPARGRSRPWLGRSGGLDPLPIAIALWRMVCSGWKLQRTSPVTASMANNPIGLGVLLVHIPLLVAVGNQMPRVGQGAEERIALQGDDSPGARFAVRLSWCLEARQQLTCGRIDPQALLPRVHIQSRRPDAVIATGARGAHQVFPVINLLNPRQRILPELASVVSIHAEHSIHSLDEHAAVEKQRRPASAMATWHGKGEVVEPQHAQRALDDRVVGAVRVGRIAVLVSPGAGAFQRPSLRDVHSSRTTETGHAAVGAKNPQVIALGFRGPALFSRAA